MRYLITDLVDMNKLKELMGSLYWMTDVAAGILDADGRMLFCAGWRNPCSSSKDPCDCHRAIVAQLTPQRYSFHKCPTGLLHYACPIIIEDSHVASVYLGQFFLAPPDESAVKLESLRLGIDSSRYLETLQQFPVITPMKLTLLLKYLQDLANLLADIGLQKLRQIEAYNLLQQKEDHLKHLSCHDPLTGLPNRACFEETLASMQNSSVLPAAIVVCDLDGLKLINDTMGHSVGDILIKAAANVIRESAPPSAVVSRIGGDEFVVLLPKSTKEDLNALRSTILDKVAAHNLNSPSSPLSLSVGIAIAESLPLDMRLLFQEADTDMYHEKIRNVSAVRSSSAQALLHLLKTRDFGDDGHTDRMETIMVRLAERLDLPEKQKGELHLFARFHDVGKVAVPERILGKTGPLTADERRIVERHSEIGHRIVLSFQETVPIADWILKHHEWWNGKGYPLGLKGDEIPLPSRLLSIVDAFDAMTSERPYRNKLSLREAFHELRRGAGVQFDPALVETVIEVIQFELEGNPDNASNRS